MHIEPDVASQNRLLLALGRAQIAFFEWHLAGDRLEFFGTQESGLHAALGGARHRASAWLESVHPDDRPALIAFLEASAAGAGGLGAVDAQPEAVAFRRADGCGGNRWLEVKIAEASSPASSDQALVAGIIRDITQDKQAQTEAARARHLYAALSASNQAIVRARDPVTLAKEICHIAVEHGKFLLAVVTRLNPGSGQIEFTAHAGQATDYLSSLQISIDPAVPEGRGPTGTSLRENRSVVWNDFHADPSAHPWRAAAERAQVRSSASIPIRRQGQVWGVFGVYSAEVDYFDASLLRLLEEMTENVALAIDTFERDLELRHVEARLLDSEALAKGVLNAAIDPIICLDDQANIIAFNPAAERTLGWSAADTLGRPFTEVIVPPRFRNERRQTMARFFATGESAFLNQRRESVAWRRDGSELPIEIVTIASRIGTRLMLTLYLRDISEFKRNQHMLNEIAARYRQLVDRSPEALLVHRSGRLMMANQACQRLLGVREESELVGRDLFAFIRADHHALAREWIAARSGPETGTPQFMEQVWIKSDGTEVIVETASTRLDDEGDSAHQVVLRDITDRKRAEEIQTLQNHVLSLIAGDAGLPAIMGELVTFLDAQCTRARGSIMLLTPDGTALHQCVAPSLPATFAAAIDPTAVGPEGAICGTAAYRGEPVIVRDVSTDPLTATLASLAAAHAIAAGASWPIMGKRGQILGTFALYYATQTEPNPLEMALIALTTDLAGIAIENCLADDRIRHLAHYDDLTSLPNRFLFRQMLELGLAKARRYERKLATLFLDLDRFKNINDTFGHAIGDDVLREASRRFRACLRDSDQIARMGGDEFFILIEDVGQVTEITEIARRVLEVAARPFFVKGEECQLSASIGVAVFPEDGEDGDTLLKNADIAMYRAKGQGKNTFQFYSASKNVHTVQRMALEARLRRAIENAEFVLHYQPRVDLRTGQVRAVEALVRWQHPERGLLLPGEFISIAEETGLIVPLGRTILETAMTDARRFESALGRVLRVAVNLSVRQIDEPNFVDGLALLLAKKGVHPGTLELELTESMLIHNPDHAERVVGELREMGIGVSIDDFGTGYSSLTYLRRFPVETVKIDRSFICDLPGNSSDLAITQAIIAMTHSLGLNVVAEGVETPEQMATLQRMGCDEYQGFLFSRPVPLEAVLERILAVPAVA